jgi:hypothetical protein
LLVQALEMAAIVRQHGAAEGVSVGQDHRIGSASRPVFLHSKHVMALQTQFLYHPIVKILVGIEVHLRSLHQPGFTFFIFPDGVVNLFAVCSGMLPGCRQIGGAK